MAKRSKLPPGLYRRRKRDGTPGEVWWFWYRPPGSKRAVQMSTRTVDLVEAEHFMHRKLAEDTQARAARIVTASVTVADALALLRKHRDARGTAIHRALYAGLQHALGHLLVGDLRPVHLDDLCARWRAVASSTRTAT